MEITIHPEMLSDAPLTEEKDAQFLIRPGINMLAEDVMFGKSTCYLVSGYRGVGKTSFLKQVEFRINDAVKNHQTSEVDKKSFNKDTVFVYTNLAIYHSHGKLLRKLIRELFLSLNDKDTFKQLLDDEKIKPAGEQHAHLLQKLYDKTFFEVSQSSTNSETNETTYTDEKNYTAWVFFFLPAFFVFFFWGHMNFSEAGTKNRIDLAGLILAILVQAFNFYKLSKKTTYTEKDSDEIIRRSLYDDDIADYHFCDILKKLKPEFKIVFVLDELDKQEIKEQERSLAEVKPYLVSGLASFILVAGQELYYQYDKAKSADDGILRSLFARLIHVPLFSYEQLEKMLFENVLVEGEVNTPEKRSLVTGYCHYLFFESRGVSRTFISLLRQQLSWLDGTASISIGDDPELYKVYQLLNEYIETVMTKQVNPLGMNPAINDYYRMQYYRIADYMLSTKGGYFKLSQVLSTLKISTGRNNAYYLTSFPHQLASMLQEKKMLVAERDPENAEAELEYSLSRGQALTQRAVSAEKNTRQEFAFTLTNFRNVISNVFRELYRPFSNDLPLSQMIRKIRDNSRIAFGKKDSPRLFEIFDDMDQYLSSEETLNEAKRQIDDAAINLTEYGFNILSFFAREKFRKGLIPKQYFERENEEIFDFVFESEQGYYRRIFVETKVRKSFDGFMESTQTSLLRFAKEQNKDDYLFFVLFVEEGMPPFKRQEVQFEKAIQEIEGIKEIQSRIRLCIVPITNLPLLAVYIEQFIKEYIKDEKSFELINQDPPPTHPERNDAFIEEIFEIANKDFRFFIEPNKTETWRFGLTFSKDRQFPPIDQGRHKDESNYVYAHLCIGDYNETERKWKHPGLFKLNVYSGTVTKNPPDTQEWNSYGGQEVYFFVSINHDASSVAFFAKVNENPVIDCRINIAGFKYCKVSAWRDHDPFKISGKMEISRTRPLA